MIRSYLRGVKGMQITPHFKSSEFDCPCGCKPTLINTDFVNKLEKLRVIKNGILHVNSGYRCNAYQEHLRALGYETATGVSQHTLGNAADITDHITPGYELAEIAERAGFTAIGIGREFIHVDGRPETFNWKYKT